MFRVLDHPLLGPIRGRVNEEVIEYLGIKYGVLSDRLARSELCEDYGCGVLDATDVGPSVISPQLGCDMDQSIIQCRLPHNEFKISDIDGLNLNVYAPSYSQTASPVLVYIHGGGFGIGSNSWPQYSLARIVSLSIKRGLPVIGININYRLGVLGFLTSTELRNADYSANNGIRDQQIALLWIAKYISGFGGDPDNITVIGESAGGVSGTIHLQSSKPLFKRLVCMGGNSLLMKPMPLSVTEHAYGAVLQALGIESSSSVDRIKALLDIPVESLYKRIPPSIPLMPVIDGEIILGAPNFQQISTDKTDDLLPGRIWCNDLLIGDCGFDGSIFSMMLDHRKTGIAQTFITSLSITLRQHPSEIESLLEAYDISKDTADDDAMISILKFASEVCFHASTLAWANSWSESQNAYVYHFNEPNPWIGSWKGKATHVLDVAFLLLNFQENLSNKQRDVAEAFASHVIHFVHGKKPFPPFLNGEGAMVYGHPADGAEFVRSSDPEAVGRSRILPNIATRIGYDLLASAWTEFLTGKHE